MEQMRSILVFELESYNAIKHLAEDDRPREKLMLKGIHSLSDAELIAILIGSGSRNESAVQLSQRILRTYENDLNKLAKLTIKELCEFKGIGEAKAVSIAAALELGRRKKGAASSERVVIKSSLTAYEVLKAYLSDLPHEEFWILILNRANAVVKSECISKGGINATLVDARLVFKPALLHSASSIVLAHNHPSGSLRPSDEDLRLTKKLREAGKLFDIAVFDHIIVGENSYYSFADEGIMN
ncbi:MAG TPA: DNA repair protein RadC [Bacteroidia bacterium]